jgi:uncharacterized protein YciI
MISTYLVPLDEVDKLRDDHLGFVAKLHEAGYVVSAGRQDPPTGGVILLDVDTEEEAHALLAEDPYLLDGAAEYRAVGWRPTRGVLSEWTRKRA